MWLGNALLDLLCSDPSISERDRFYVKHDQDPLSVPDILTLDMISMPELMLGLWHFIITRRPDNEIGRETFLSWHEKHSKNSTPVFVSDIGTRERISPLIIRGTFDDADWESQTAADLEDEIPSFSFNLPKSGMGKIIDNDPDYDRNYYLTAIDKYSKKKTLLYNDTPEDFYSFFVCNDILPNSGSKIKTKDVISDCTVDKLTDISNFIIITGNAGLGKSMMMRHLFLRSLEDWPHTTPILVPVKNYNPGMDSITSYIYRIYTGMNGRLEFDDFERFLQRGKFTFLLDGLDEIKDKYRYAFCNGLDELASKYVNNRYIVSSRPYSDFIALSKFTVVNLAPFNKNHALKLIDNLRFRPDEPDIKARFRSELDNQLYDSHRSFCENPLLLTIMLMTYEQFAEIPSKMHIFYKEVYETLSIKHDATKGAFRRPFCTGLSAEEFRKLFSEFCARTYYDEKYDFTESEIAAVFAGLNYVSRHGLTCSYRDFINDLTEYVCLMYFEGGRYSFTHRSFQEYFCALYFSEQKDRQLSRIGEFFEVKKELSYSDITFDMLHDMIPDRVEEFIFLNYLDTVFTEHASSYHDYLRYYYPVLLYASGKGAGLVGGSVPGSFILSKICSYRNIIHEDYRDMIPVGSELVQKHDDRIRQNSLENRSKENLWKDFSIDVFVYITTGANKVEIFPRGYVTPEYIEAHGEPEHAGYTVQFSMNDILSKPDEYSEQLQAIDADTFPLKKEYDAICRYYQDLKNRTHKSKSSEDFFDGMS